MMIHRHFEEMRKAEAAEEYVPFAETAAEPEPAAPVAEGESIAEPAKRRGRPKKTES